MRQTYLSERLRVLRILERVRGWLVITQVNAITGRNVSYLFNTLFHEGLLAKMKRPHIRDMHYMLTNEGREYLKAHEVTKRQF